MWLQVLLDRDLGLRVGWPTLASTLTSPGQYVSTMGQILKDFFFFCTIFKVDLELFSCLKWEL